MSERREEAAPDAGGGPDISDGGALKTGGLWPEEPARVGVQALALEPPRVLGPGAVPAVPSDLATARAAVRAVRVRFSRSSWAFDASKPFCISAWKFISNASSSRISLILLLFFGCFGIAEAKLKTKRM